MTISRGSIWSYFHCQHENNYIEIKVSSKGSFFLTLHFGISKHRESHKIMKHTHTHTRTRAIKDEAPAALLPATWRRPCWNLPWEPGGQSEHGAAPLASGEIKIKRMRVELHLRRTKPWVPLALTGGENISRPTGRSCGRSVTSDWWTRASVHLFIGPGSS